MPKMVLRAISILLMLSVPELAFGYCNKSGEYLNSSGHYVKTPRCADNSAGANYLCRDGSYSFSEHFYGACNRHGGVDQILNSKNNFVASFNEIETLEEKIRSIYNSAVTSIKKVTYEGGIFTEALIYALAFFVAFLIVYLLGLLILRIKERLFLSPNKKPCRWVKDNLQPIDTTIRWVCETCGEFAFTDDEHSPLACEKGRWRDYL